MKIFSLFSLRAALTKSVLQQQSSVEKQKERRKRWKKLAIDSELSKDQPLPVAKLGLIFCEHVFLSNWRRSSHYHEFYSVLQLVSLYLSKKIKTRSSKIASLSSTVAVALPRHSSPRKTFRKDPTSMIWWSTPMQHWVQVWKECTYVKKPITFTFLPIRKSPFGCSTTRRWRCRWMGSRQHGGFFQPN